MLKRESARKASWKKKGDKCVGEMREREDDVETGFRGADGRWQMRGVGGGLGGKQEGEKARKYWGQSPIAPNTLPKSCRKLFFISYCGCRGKEGE